MTVRNSLRLLQRLKAEGVSGVIVGYSGGKDSEVVLDLCCQVFDRVEAFFGYLLPDLECEQRNVRRARIRYAHKLETIHQMPSPFMGGFLRSGYLTKPEHFERAYKWRDIEQAMRSRTGLKVVVYGHRMTESLQRRGMLNGTGGDMRQYGKVYPIWDWSTRQVYSYLTARRIEFPHTYGRFDTNGTGLCSEALAVIAKEWPDDFQKICERFPGVRSKLLRNKIRAEEAQKQAEQVSMRSAGADASPGIE